MKLAQHDNKLETNVETVSQDFGIGDASVVIEILRNRLYEHKIRTLVQEYMCNGRDAQREINQTKRLVVSVPNALSPVFKVRDFGPGITPERMAKVFVLYGASTKRGTNGQTGGFGIGAKSAWSYTDSFTIVSVTDGVKRTYVAHTGVNNQGRLDKLSEVETDEENGTEIQVAVKPHDCREFKTSIQRAAYFWKESERPEFRGVTAGEIQFHQTNLLLGKHLEIAKGRVPDFIGFDYGDRAAMVIDGVPYPLTDKLVTKVKAINTLVSSVKTFAILHVTNGVVEVGANRESIADSEFTRNALETLALASVDLFKVHIKTKFKAVKTSGEWISTYRELNELSHVDEHSKFGKYTIDHGSIMSEQFKLFAMAHVGTSWRRESVKRDSARSINLSDVKDVFYLDNADESFVIQNRRIKEYMVANKKTGLMLLNPVQIDGFKRAADGSFEKDAKGEPIKIIETSLADSTKAMDKVIKDFGARPLSSLTYTPIVRVPKAKRDRQKEEFTIHNINYGGKHPHTTTLEQVEASGIKYLHVPFEQWEKFQHEMSDLYSFLDNNKMRACCMTKKSLDMVEDSKFFIEYKEWKSNFKATQDMINQVKSLKATNSGMVKLLARADARIKDKHIVKMLKEYESLPMIKADSVPEMIQKIVADDVKSFIEGDKELTRLVKECYPLITVVGHAGDWRVTKTEANELVTYINAKN